PRPHHLLADAPEQALTVGVGHLDVDRVAELHERGAELAGVDLLPHALLGDAARALRRLEVGDGAAADDGARGEAARLRGVLEQVVEAEVHLGPRVWLAEQLAVPPGPERQVNATALPGLPELVGGDGEGR